MQQNNSLPTTRRSRTRSSVRARVAAQTQPGSLRRALGVGVLVVGAAASVQAANDAWSTTPANGNFTGINWTVGTTTPAAPTGTIAAGDSLYFGTSSITTLNNDEAAGFSIAGLFFNAGASAYTIGGNSFALSGGITNSSTALQTINTGFTVAATNTFTTSAGGGNLALGGAISGTGGLTFTGTGTTSLTAAGTLTGGTALININGGRSVVNFASTGTLSAAGGTSVTGAAATDNIALNVSAGTLTLADTQLANNGSYGSLTISGGTLNSNNFRSGGTTGTGGSGYILQTGGTVNNAALVTMNRNGTGTNVMNLTGGTFNGGNNGINLGFVSGGTGVLTVSGTGQFLQSTAGNSTINLGQNGSTGIVNLNAGGLVRTGGLGQGYNGTGVINFNGGTLQALQAGGTFTIPGASRANIYAGGGTIDTNTFNITVAQPLLTTTGTTGVTTIPVTNGGSGYIGAPVVTFTGGGGGIGATAVANLTNGVVTSVTITSAGTGYTTAPTITLVGGGATTAAMLGTVGTGTITANDGGLTKTGAGVLTLTGASTYNGGTFVNNGTLLANFAGASVTSSSTGTGPVAVGNAAGTLTGTLGGVGTISGNITVNPGSTITGGAVGAVGTLNAFANLTLAGTAAARATFAVDIAGAAADQLAISGVLTLSNAAITITGTPTAASYMLATYASVTGTFAAVTAPAGYAVQFNPNGTELDLVAVPEPSVWMSALALGGLLGLARRRQVASWLAQTRG